MGCMFAKGGRTGRPAYGLGFRSGNNQIRFYSQSLYWLVRHVGLENIMTEFIGDGELVIYGELSDDQLDCLVAEGRLRHISHHFWGIRWPYSKQIGGTNEDFSDFEIWRNGLLTCVHDASCDTKNSYRKLLN